VRQEVEGKYLRIQKLNKTLSNGVQAVKNLNLRMYQNQIFVLIGESGAGKSTMINILAGLISPTDGKVFGYDKDLVEQAGQVRSFMGVC
jgi:ABC-type multidrug transport system ATPase subunit